MTLTATVNPASATGRVTFYDGSVVLGTATISGGVATLRASMNLSGSRSLTARYLGDSSNAPALSAAISESVNATGAFGFNVNSLDLGFPITDFVVVDVNGDGKQDLVMMGTGNLVGTAFGNGDGTFGSPVTTISGLTTSPYFRNAIAVGDWDGDGKIDIIACSSTQIVVMLGNGDGTFTSKATYAAAGGGMTVGDFNLDGVPDIAIVHPLTQSIGIMLGSGDGTFAGPIEYSTLYIPSAVAIGDLNGDGTPDLVTIVPTPGAHGSLIVVLIGNGDGTFQAARSYTLYPTLPFEEYDTAILLADINNDGKLDLAISAYFTYGIWICAGNGDGTFGPPVQHNGANQGYGLGIAAADFNGDGKIDVVSALKLHPPASGIDIVLQKFYGNGDGTFAPVHVLSLPAVLSIAKLVQADFNGDGRVDLLSGGFDATYSYLLMNLYSGALLPELNVSSSHSGDVSPGQAVTSTVVVSNQAGTSATSGVVTVTYYESGFESLVSMAGAGWHCSVSTQACSRSDALVGGASYPAITVITSVSSAAPLFLATNVILASGGGSATAEGFEPVNIVALMPPGTPTLVAPPAGAIVTYAPSLSWLPSSGAANYDVYFGTSSSPPLVATVLGTSYGPPALSTGTIYYWQIVAKNSAGSASSAVWSFAVSTTAGKNLGVFRNGQWWLDGNGDFSWTGSPDRFLNLGQAGDIAIMGDWDNTGVRRVGVFRNGQWWLDMNNDGQWDAVHDIVFSYGQAGDIPVIGDWDGTGVQRIGVFRNGQWWLDMNGDHVWDAVHDIVFSYGQSGDVPIVGDWDNTGLQRIGVFRSGQWWLDMNNDHVWDAVHDTEFSYGIAGDIPVIGDWTHSGQTRIGVFRQSQWWLDMNGDHVWDSVHDLVVFFGLGTDQPVIAP